MLSIHNPCPESWNNMSPVNGGRFCDSCCKVVVDFTKCSNEEIVDYLNNNNGARVCGKLKREMVAIPKPKFHLTRFLAALLLVFSGGLFSSCHNGEKEHVVGDVAYTPDSAQLAHNKMMQDSIDKANAVKPEAPFHLSAKDSARIEDSIAKTKNQIRDFK